MVASGPHSPYEQSNPDGNQNKRRQWRLNSKPLPKSCDRKPEPNENPESFDRYTIDLAKPLHPERDYCYTKQTNSHTDVKQPRNADPDEKQRPTGCIESAPAIMPPHKCFHLFYVPTTVRPMTPISYL